MKLLLDTCSLLWALHAPRKLSIRAQKALADPANPIYVSAVSFWEISLKASIGKLELIGASPDDFPGMVEQEDWQILPLDASTASSVHELPRSAVHKDPFDRMLIHLSIRDNYHFVSKDGATPEYERLGLKICW